MPHKRTQCPFETLSLPMTTNCQVARPGCVEPGHGQPWPGCREHCMAELLIRDAMIVTVDGADTVIERGTILVEDGWLTAVRPT